MSGHFVVDGEMRLEDLKAKLEGEGWRIYAQTEYFRKGADWYACRKALTDRECVSNEKIPPICIVPYAHNHNGKRWEGVEIDLTAAWPDRDTWWKLTGYSMTPQKCAEVWPDVCARLTKAWEAL